MLSQLADAIAAVAPIFGVADLGDGQYRIDFRPEATPEQQQDAWAVVANFQPTLPPDWDAFRIAILTSGAYLRIVTSTPIATVLNSAMNGLLWQLGGNPSLFLDVAQVWGRLAQEAQPTAEEIAELNAIGEATRMPFRLKADGSMVLTAEES